MEPDDVLAHFGSREPRQIYEATWQILRCGDAAALEALHPHLPRLRAIVAQVDLGGMVRRNADDTELAFRYVENSVQGLCRCQTLYVGDTLLDPAKEADLGFVTILSSQDHLDLHEQHFQVQCTGCSRHLTVREVNGWHVPWYAWTAGDSA